MFIGSEAAIAFGSNSRIDTRFSVANCMGSLLISGCMLLTGCLGGGGSSGGGASPEVGITLNGVAAVGRPIVNGNVSVICASGMTINPVSTDSQGNWSVSLTNQTLPCAAEVTGGMIDATANSISYHSIATSAGIVNITPLTDLIVANLVGTSTPSAWFAGLSSNPSALNNIESANVNLSFNKLVSALNGLARLGENNPVTSTLVATSGNINDDMMTALAAAMLNTGVSYTALLSNAAVPSFTVPVSGFNTALVSAFAGTPSGGASNSPGITGALPNSAAPGATVVISGANFIQAASNYRVSFNGITSTPTLRTLTQLSVIVPTVATTGTLSVTDLTTNQIYTVPGGFTVINSVAPITVGGNCTPPTNLSLSSSATFQNITQMRNALSGTWLGCDIYGKGVNINFTPEINPTGTISQRTTDYATYTNCSYTVVPSYYFPANGQVDYTVSTVACDQGNGIDQVHGDMLTVYTQGGSGTITALLLQFDFINFAIVTKQ